MEEHLQEEFILVLVLTDDGNGMTYSFDPAAAGVGTHTLTYTFTDANGCINSASDNVEVFALPTVTFTAPADLCIDAGVQTAQGGGTPTGGVYSGPGVTDDGNGMTYSFDPAAAGVGTHTLTYTFTDANGCTNSASDNVEVFALPTVTFTAPADLCIDAGVQAAQGGGTPTGGVYSGPGVTDDGNGMTYSFDPAAAGVGTHTLTYTFTDANSCTNSASDNVEVFALPVVAFTAPASPVCPDAVLTAQGGGTPSGGVYSGPGVTDDGNGMTYTFDATASGNGMHTITYTFTDTNGCSNSASDTVTVEDNVAPVITCVTSAPRDANMGVCTYTVVGTEFDATFTDNCMSMAATITNDFNMSASLNGAVLPLGANVITWTANDGNGQTAMCTTTVTVEDNEAPVITCVASAPLDADVGVCTYTVVGTEFDATFTDNCMTATITNDLTGTATIAGEVLPLGDTVVNWTVVDGNGQMATCATTVTVEDNEPPVVTCAANAVRDINVGACTYTVVGAEFDATFTDNCMSATITNNLTTSATIAGAVLPIGDTVVTWTVDDGNGQMATCNTTITVDDNIPPTIDTVAVDMTVECDGDGNTMSLNEWLADNGGATASDNCGGITWTNDFMALSDDCGNTGSALVTFTATDDDGETNTTAATFAIIDTAAPTIDAEASNLTVECDGEGNLTELNAWLASIGTTGAASDDCSGDLTPVIPLYPLTSGTQTDDIQNEDDDSEEHDLGFDFTFFGNTFDSVWIGSNGTLSFTDSDDYCCSGDPVDDGSYENVIAFMNTDLDPGDQGDDIITYQTVGTAPNREFVVSYFQVPNYDDTDLRHDGQVILYESTGVIDIYYGGNDWVLEDEMTIGISNEDGDIGVAAPGWVEFDNSTFPTYFVFTPNGASYDVTTAGGSTSAGAWTNDFVALSDDCGNTGSALVTFTVDDGCGNTSSTQATFTIIDSTNPTIEADATDLTVACDGSGNITELNDWLASIGTTGLASDICSGLVNPIVPLYDLTSGTETDDIQNEDDDSENHDLGFDFTFFGNTFDSVWIGSNGTLSFTDSDDYCCSGDPVDDGSYENVIAFMNTDLDPGDQGDDIITYQTVGTAPNREFVVSYFQVPNYDDTDLRHDGQVILYESTGVIDIYYGGNDWVLEDEMTIGISNEDGDIGVAAPGWVEFDNSTFPTYFVFTPNGASYDVAVTEATFTGGVIWTNDFVDLVDDCGNTGAGSALVTFTATDDCGNSSTTQATFTIEDNEAPVITCIADDTRDAAADICFYTVFGAEFDATFTDNCNNSVITNDFSGTETLDGSALPLGDTTITWTVDDCDGQTATCTTTVTVIDVTPVTVISGPIDIFTGTGPSDDDCETTVNYGVVDINSFVIEDNCGDASTTTVVQTAGLGTGASFPVGVTAEEFTLTDSNGNETIYIFNVTITDTTAPVVDCPGDLIVSDGGTGVYTIEDYTATVTDNCSSGADLVVTQDPVSGTEVANGSTTTVTVTATDAAGNVTTCEFDILVDSTLGVEDTLFNEASISMYPNPTAGELNILAGNTTVDKVEIYDLNGRMVKRVLFNTADYQFNLNEMDAAVYLVQIFSGSNMVVKRVIKK